MQYVLVENMQISKKKKKQLQHNKELKSLRNKMGSNIVWFDSLSKTKQFDILFAWKKKKFSNKLQKPEYVLVNKRVLVDPKRPYGRYKFVKESTLKYPVSLKYFILECRNLPNFQPHINKIRENTIDLLLNNN